MKTKPNPPTLVRTALLALAASGLCSCATFDHPLARHDLDRSGTLSHAEYQQANMGYNVAHRQRVDEYQRASLVTGHLNNANNFLGQAHRSIGLLQGFGRY
jgi:hypothetical protein